MLSERANSKTVSNNYAAFHLTRNKDKTSVMHLGNRHYHKYSPIVLRGDSPHVAAALHN